MQIPQDAQSLYAYCQASGMKVRTKRPAVLMRLFAFGYMLANLRLSAYSEFMDRFSTHVGQTLYVCKSIDTASEWQRLLAHELQHHDDLRTLGAMEYIWTYTDPESRAVWPFIFGIVASFILMFFSGPMAAASAIGGIVAAVGLFFFLRKQPSPGRTRLELRAYKVTLYVMMKQGYKGDVPDWMVDLFTDHSYLWMAPDTHKEDIRKRLQSALDRARHNPSDLWRELPLTKELDKVL